MRGLFTAGILDVFMENGIRFDGIVGVSAGATFGCNYKSHQIGRVLRYNMRFRKEPRYMGLRSLITDVHTGNPVYHRIDDFTFEEFDWIRASASMPIVSRPVSVGGYELLDGGISDSIPLRYFESEGFSRNVVILTQPKGFTKKRTRLMPVFRTAMRNYPAIVEAMDRRHIMYNSELDYISKR